MSETAISANIEITKLCGLRDFAIERMTKALSLMAVARQYADEAQAAAHSAATAMNDAEAGKVCIFHRNDRRETAAYRRIFEPIDIQESLRSFTEQADAGIWMRVLKDTGMERLMDAQAREEFFKQLETAPPAVSEEAIASALTGLAEDSKLIFQRGIANVFTSLDKRFKSHDAFELDARIILTRMFNEWGSFSYYGKERQMLIDVERVFAVLDGADPEGGNLLAALEKQRSGFGPRQTVYESRYMRVRGYKNGNAHLWFTRPDLVQKVNLQLAEFYGAVLPDGVAKDDPLPKSGLPAKDLSFYATPPEVAKKLIYETLYAAPNDRPMRILEPSAGTGGILHVLFEEVARLQREDYRRKDNPLRVEVDVVEIEPTRAAQLRRLRGISVYEANFLRMAPRPVYDLILMNPPFYGTHWMEHVRHAFDFLAPGGRLRAILPITAELGTSKQHVAFREWAKPRMRYTRDEVYFESLPPESFASSGTRVNTCILDLFAGR